MAKKGFTKPKRTSKIGLVLYIISMTLVCFLLYYMNDVIAYILNDTKVVDFNSYTVNENIRCSLDTYGVNGSIDDSVYIGGWGFIPAPATEDKQINIILKSDKETYEIVSVIGKRADVFHRYAGTTGIPSANCGFRADFSTLGIQNGVYDVYIYVKESDGNEGITYLNYRLNKDSNNISFQKWIAYPFPSIADALPSIPRDTVHIGADRVIIEDERALSIAGWAFCQTEGDNTGKYTELYITSPNNTYVCTMSNSPRPDVYKIYKDSLKIIGEQHGFNGVYDVTNLPDGEYELHVAVYETDTEQGIVKLGQKLIIENGAARIE